LFPRKNPKIVFGFLAFFVERFFWQGIGESSGDSFTVRVFYGIIY